MYNDYVIADRRIRVVGPQSDLAAAGLRSFAPFAVEYDPEAETAVEIETGPYNGAPNFEELTRFDFSEEATVCRFGRNGNEYALVIGEGRRGRGAAFVYDIDERKIKCDIGGRLQYVRFGLWFMANMAVAPHLAAAVHASAIVHNGEAVVFLGESGTGKSTHARLWRENIEGAELLNDDSPFVAVTDGRPVAFGSPWSGKTPCYKNERYPLRAAVRLSQAPHNSIRRLLGARAVGALLPSLPPAFAYDDRLESLMLDTLSAIVNAVPVYHLECRPDGEAARLVHDTIFGI